MKTIFFVLLLFLAPVANAQIRSAFFPEFDLQLLPEDVRENFLQPSNSQEMRQVLQEFRDLNDAGFVTLPRPYFGFRILSDPRPWASANPNQVVVPFTANRYYYVHNLVPQVDSVGTVISSNYVQLVFDQRELREQSVAPRLIADGIPRISLWSHFSERTEIEPREMNLPGVSQRIEVRQTVRFERPLPETMLLDNFPFPALLSLQWNDSEVLLLKLVKKSFTSVPRIPEESFTLPLLLRNARMKSIPAQHVVDFKLHEDGLLILVWMNDSRDLMQSTFRLPMERMRRLFTLGVDTSTLIGEEQFVAPPLMIRATSDLPLTAGQGYKYRAVRNVALGGFEPGLSCQTILGK